MKTRASILTYAKGQANFETLSDEPRNISSLQGQVPRTLNDQAMILKERGDLDGAMALHKEEARTRAEHCPALKLHVRFSRMQLSRRLLPSGCNRRN